MLVNNQWLRKEIKREVKKHSETHENGNTPKFMGCSEAVLRNLIKVNTYIRKEKDLNNKKFHTQGTRKNFLAGEKCIFCSCSVEFSVNIC